MVEKGLDYGNLLYGSVSQDGSIEEPVKLYGRRWYILFLFALICLANGFTSSYIGTVEHSMTLAFDWSKIEITLLGVWPKVMFLLTFGVTSWLLDAKGLRATCLLASGFVAAGSAVQCISSTPPYPTWTFQLAQILIGGANPLIYGGEAVMAVTWFPPHQRTLAISLALFGLYIGIASSSIIGPIAVPVRDVEPFSSITNFTSNIRTTEPSGVPQNILQMREDIMHYVYIQCGVSVAVFLALLIYFPNKPPSPPSISASSDRVDFKSGIISIVRKPMFWLILVVLSITSSVNGVYASLLGLILMLNKVPDDQTKAGHMMLGTTIGGMVLSFIVASLVDRFKNSSKHILIACVTAASGLMLWFAIILQGIVVPTTAQLYISFILGQALLLSIVPVFYELACDITYPVGEGLTGGALNLGGNLLAIMFLLIQIIPNISPRTLNWVCFGSLSLYIPLLLVFKPSKPRV